jgi:glycosyltransferase involved in cell wall biosynthesis
MTETDPPTVSVVTPAYNAAETLPKVAEGLRSQTWRAFEWVVVDDGSTDGTAELVERWLREGDLDIRYLHQENRGKHVAMNRGIERARGEYTVVLDADVLLPPTTFERMLATWETIPEGERAGFSAVVGQAADTSGRLLGAELPSEPYDSDYVQMTYVLGLGGDRMPMHRTAALREFPFPFEELRGLVTEAIVANRMARKYRERYVNEVWAITDYLPGGLSDRALELQIRAAAATALFFLEETQLPQALPWKRRLRSYGNFARFSFHAGHGLRRQLREAPSKLRWLALAPVGYGFYRRDRRRFPAAH